MNRTWVAVTTDQNGQVRAEILNALPADGWVNGRLMVAIVHASSRQQAEKILAKVQALGTSPNVRDAVRALHA